MTEKFIKVLGLPEEGKEIKVTWRGKEYRGIIVGNHLVKLRSGYKGRMIEKADGRKILMPWTKRAQYYEVQYQEKGEKS